jgi:hypothetical protein
MFKKILLPIAFIFVLSSCATSQICAKPEAVDSLICPTLAKVNMTPESANLMFKLANIELLRNNVYAKADVLKFFDNVESVLDVDTYSQLVQYMLFEIAGINSAYAIEFLLITEALTQFQTINLPISDFDKGLLKAHIAQQRSLLTLVQ